MNEQKSPALPDESQIEELLGKIQPVPGEEFRKKMEQAAWRFDAEKRPAGRIRWKTAAALMVVAALTGLFASPQGRAWAQEVFQFFTKIQS